MKVFENASRIIVYNPLFLGDLKSDIIQKYQNKGCKNKKIYKTRA